MRVRNGLFDEWNGSKNKLNNKLLELARFYYLSPNNQLANMTPGYCLNLVPERWSMSWPVYIIFHSNAFMLCYEAFCSPANGLASSVGEVGADFPAPTLA